VSTRRFVGTLATVVSGAVLAACSLVQSLDYLQADLDKPLSGDERDASDESASSEGGALKTPEVIASAQARPDLLVLDADAAFWVNRETSAIMTAPKQGGAPRTVVIEQGGPIATLAVDPDPAGYVYWATGTTLRRTRKDGTPGPDGGPQVLFTGAPPILGIAVDDVAVYGFQRSSTDTAGIVFRSAKDGTARVVLEDKDTPEAILLDGNNLLWVGVDAEADTWVRSLPRDAAPGAAKQSYGIAGDLFAVAPPTSVAADDRYFYCGDRTDPGIVTRVLRVPGVGSESVYGEGEDENILPQGIALDDTYLWFTDLRSSSLVRFRKDNPAPRPTDLETVVKDLLVPTSVRVDGAFVYFAAQGTAPNEGRILRVTR